jgi:predicted membrane protein
MRAASLFLACVASLIGLVFPFILARQPTGLNQTILLFWMAGIAGGFIYGAGFQPQSRFLRLAIAPGATWPVLLGSLAILLWLR